MLQRGMRCAGQREYDVVDAVRASAFTSKVTMKLQMHMTMTMTET